MLVAATYRVYTGDEQDKYLLLSGRELRVGATQQPAEEKSTWEPAR